LASLLPVCYLNGAFVPIGEARISPFDRGFLFADGAYEVMPVYGRRPFRFEDHCARLTRSLAALSMDDPLGAAGWRELVARLIEVNGAADLYIYWQVTRGAELGRNHAPLPALARTVFAFAAPLPPTPPQVLEQGLACITASDTRWARCDVKSVALLANVLLRQLAVDAGAAETILLKDGELTDASASAVHVVIAGELRTPPRSPRLLPGTTRTVIEDLADRVGLAHRSVRVTEADLRGAEELWLSAATREVVPVTRLDGRTVGAGLPGPKWRQIYDALQQYKRELAGRPW
jgi:D-alanine transaminase